jgi:hypothetical protein
VKRAAFALAFVFASMASAKASDQSFGSFSIRSDQPDLIYLDGDIGFDTYADFGKARRAAPNATTLILNSPGGNVDQAIRIARDVRSLDLRTYVPLRHGCYSACAYIYLAGVDRRATGQLGVHQISDPAFTAASLQQRLAELLDLFHDLGVDAQITSHMLRTPPEALYILDRKQVRLLNANADSGGWLDAMDDLFGHLSADWAEDETNDCPTIEGGVGWSGGCVPAEWIPTAPNGSERYFYQDADHQMGLMILDDPEEWTREELREVVLEAASAQREEGAAEVFQEMKWPVAGVTFDLMVYPGRSDAGDVLYQHFYRALPQGGALQVLIYSAAGQAWQATSKVTQLFSHLKFDEAPPAPAAVVAFREPRSGERQIDASR